MGLLGAQEDAGLMSHEIRRVDYWLILSVLFVIGIGLVNLYSTTFDPVKEQSAFLWKQIIFIGIGSVVAIVSLFFDYRWTEQLAVVFYGFNLVALIGVRFLGVIRNGARLWYDFGIFAYQPSETMKLAMIILLAKYFHGKRYQSSMGFSELLIPALIVGIPSLVTIAQPDMGTGFQMAVTGATLILFVGVRPRILLSIAILGMLSFPVVWKYGLQEYQRDRIRIVLDPMKDPKGRGYNALQSMIAVGSGQVVGKGFQSGTQTQLGFTPEGYTDFIFTVLAEEWGFAGVMFFFFSYMAMILRCFFIASSAREKYGLFLAFGIASLISWQALINIAMVVGIFPIVGIPLPLLSYGGTSVITVLIALGLVLNVSYRRNIF